MELMHNVVFFFFRKWVAQFLQVHELSDGNAGLVPKKREKDGVATVS